MKTKLAALSALVLLCAASAPAATAIHTNLWEGFSSINASWSAGAADARKVGVYQADEAAFSDNNGASPTDVQGWRGSWIFPTRSSIRLGNGTYRGYAVSPLVELSDEASAPSTATISFHAANYNSSAGKVNVTLLDEDGEEIDGFSFQSGVVRKLENMDLADMDDNSYASDSENGPFSVTFENLPSSFKVKLQSVGDGRISIDSVLVSQSYDNGLTTLDTPVVTATAEMDGLWLSWTAIANAYDYELQVLDPDGEQAGTWSFNHEQSASQWSGVHVEGLAEETEYTVRLRVLGDGTTYANSSWFEDTFSTIADPWRPEWTIGDPTPSPFVGTAFSFGVSAFRYIPGFDGTDPQTVAFDGLTPVPAGTQPAFANGVFSWTPGMDDDGDYVAAFSVQNDGGTYTTNVVFTVKGTTEEDILFEETFAKCVTVWGNNADFSASWADDDHAWVVDGAKRGMSGLRLGNKSVYNAAVTPTIHPQNDAAATVALSFLAAGWEAGGQMTVTVRDATTQNALFSQTISLAVFPDVNNPIPTTEGFAFGPYPVSVSGPFTVSFQRAAGDGRMGIDSVKVTQKVSTSLIDLDVPTGLAVVDGTRSTNSFSVAWNAVANASSYGLEVYEAGVTDPVRSLAPTATSAAFAGLSDDTDYEVRVRAQGDTSRYNYSDWTNLVVHTERSALHPTLSVGASWENVIGDGKLYGVIPNTNAVSATLDDGTTPVAVELVNVAPAPSSAPGLADGTLTWTPATEDEGTTFTLFFEMTPAPGVVYTNTASFKVNALPALQAPTVTMDADSVTNAGGFASGRAELSWNSQFRATDYAVRAWTDCPNPAATATRVEESFDDFFHGTRPAGWKFKVVGGYDNSPTAPVKFDDGNWMATYDLGGEISSVSFTAYGHSMNSNSTLRVYWAGALTDEEVADKDNWTNNLVAAVSGLVSHSQTVTAQIPAGSGARRLVWQFEKHGGNVGVGSVVIEGTGFSTPKFLPGWGPTPVSQGLALSCTVSPTRPGRKNWVEVSVTDGTVTFAKVVEIDVPDANPVTLLILK